MITNVMVCYVVAVCSSLGQVMTDWRYQAAFSDATGERVYFVIEVYLDDIDRLEHWTGQPMIPATGETAGELIEDLEQMLAEVRAWKAVAIERLEVGMTFEPSSERPAL